jgi:hypothetical protein
MSQTEEKEEVKTGLIYSKTGFRLFREIWGDLELRGKFLPLEAQGWGNYEEYIIKLSANNVEVARIRNNWNGTGSDIIAHCELSDDQADKLHDQMLKAKDLNDFKALLNHLLATC